MWSYNLFRIGAGILTTGGILYLFDVLAPRTADGVDSLGFQLEQLLYGHKTNVMGTMRSKGEIYDGLRMAFSVYLLSLGGLGFLSESRWKVAGGIALSLAVMLAISVTHWYALPSAFLGLGLLCFAGSAYLGRNANSR